MYCFNFFRNQLWQHLISYNSFRNMNMCLLEVVMCEKCRSSHFQSETGGLKNIRTRGLLFLEVDQYSISCHATSFFKFCSLPSLSYQLQLPSPQLFLLSCFFGWMCDGTTFDVLFYLMKLWNYTCWAMVL